MASAQGYSVLVCMTKSDDVSILRSVVENRKIDAVILTQLKHDDENVALLKKSGLPFVVIWSDPSQKIAVDGSSPAPNGFLQSDRFFLFSFYYIIFSMNTISVKCVASSGAVIPEYKTAGAAGADICALLSEPVVIKKGCRAMIPTGLFFSIPEGYEIQVRPRSGLAAKNGVTVLNTPGTIDSDYRGEVKVILINLGDDDFEVKNGERIAQIVIAPVTVAKFEQVSVLDETERGSGGFGSTGKN